MTSTEPVKDRGMRRGEHQILTNYLPGQIISYHPTWVGDGAKPQEKSYIARISRIGQVNRLDMNGPSKMHKVWKETAPKLKSKIKVFTGKANIDWEPNLVFYEINSSVNGEMTIDLEPYPDMWEYGAADSANSRRYCDIGHLPYAEPDFGEFSQAYILFCRPRGWDAPYIDQLAMPGQECRLTQNDNPDKREIITGNVNRQLVFPSSQTANEENLMKARFPLEKSNFVPCLSFDVYSPDIKTASASALVQYWKINKLTSQGCERTKLKELADLILNITFNDSIVDVQEHIAFILSKRSNCFVGDSNDLAKKTVEFVNGDVGDITRYKIDAIKEEAALNAGWKKDIFGIFDIHYTDSLQVGNFALGYFSGKPYSPGSKANPILRKFDGWFEGGAYMNRRSSDSDLYSTGYQPNQEWPVFFQLFDTEGLMFTVKNSALDGISQEQRYPSAHALAHALIRNIPRYSGIDHGLMMEFFFEEQDEMTFILYSKEPGKFRTKGLKYLFENNIENLVYDAKDTLDCPFGLLDDSPAPHRDGCGACTMMPIGCQNFNQNLDRLGGLSILGKLSM